MCLRRHTPTSRPSISRGPLDPPPGHRAREQGTHSVQIGALDLVQKPGSMYQAPSPLSLMSGQRKPLEGGLCFPGESRAPSLLR